MSIKDKFNKNYGKYDGGLFAEVTKADVGEGPKAFMERGGSMMAWADPFMPDASVPQSVKKVLLEQIEKGTYSHYVMPIGDFALREAIANKVNRQTGLNIDPSRNVVVTPGSDTGLMYAMMMFLNEGDEVLIPNPSYPSNFKNASLLNAVSVDVPLYEEDGYQIRIEEFEKRLTPKTKMVLITHPNNPTSTVFRRESIIKLCDFIKKNDLVLVCDQAFEDHIYDGIEFVHPCTVEGMFERTVTVCSVSKGIGLSGFRIGYVYASDEVIDKCYASAVNVLGAASTLSTIGAVAAINDQEYLHEVFTRLERRKNIAYEILSSIPNVTMTKPESAFLSWVNIKALGTSAFVTKWLAEDAMVMVNSGEFYGSNGEGYLRIVTGCYKEDSDAIDCMNRIKESLIRLNKIKGLI